MAGSGNVEARPGASGRGSSVLDERSVRQHLIVRGLIRADDLIAVEPLSGGVSSDIVAVSGPGLELVVKRALPRLRVEEEWLADVTRLVTEGRALQLAYSLVPSGVPAVIDLDEDTCTLVLERAPCDWTNWRDDLLAGTIDADVGRRLGAALAIWHRETTAPSAAVSAFEDVTSFVQLRVNPFFLTAASQNPSVAERIVSISERLLATKGCLVHGDFSPKNVLTGGGSQWVLDWEVAHVGDPVFDLAYLVAHLVLKAVHREEWAPRFHAVALAFLDAYRRTDGVVGFAPEDLAETVACLLLARVDGKSPAEYLSLADQERVRTLALAALSGSPTAAFGTWIDG